MSPFISLLCVNVDISNLVYRSVVASPSIRTTNRPWKGRGYVTWPILNLEGPIHISGMTEARAVKFCTQVGYQVLSKMWKNQPQKGPGHGHVTYLNSEFPYDISGMAKDRDFKFCTLWLAKWLDYKLFLEWAWSWSRDVFIFWKYAVISQKRCKIES